jgi:hypothetical protein
MSQIAAQRALEALRNGVPNDDAVRALGCMQPTVFDRFREQLDRLERNHATPATDPGGLLISGDFGTGKSHTLSCLEHEAIRRNFVVSRIVVSKETPLHDPAKVFLAAVREARLPNGRGSLLHELASGIDYRSNLASPFFKWATTQQTQAMVAASVHIDEKSNDAELKGQIINWWSGDKISVSQIRSGMRGIGLNDKTIKAAKMVELTPIRFEFAARLAQARGFAGWVLLFDEVELIARFSLLQRAKSYAELARWLGPQGTHGITAVAAITDDYQIKVLNHKEERQVAPQRLREKAKDATGLNQAEMATLGTKLIDRDALRLQAPSEDTLAVSFGRLRELYHSAYDFAIAEQAPRRVTGPLLPMRSYVRRWIAEWDLRRLYGDVTESLIEEQPVPQDYQEDPESMREVEERLEPGE